MPLSSGDKLSHYEILEPLGEGGISEVYRAKDTNLKRDVALKVLPSPSRAIPSEWRDSRARPKCWRRSTTPISPRSTASKQA